MSTTIATSASSAAAATSRTLEVRNLTRGTVLSSAIEIADTGPARNKGLLGRDGISEGGGLWIVPCESVHTFFMRFPVDLVYIDSGHRVTKVRSSVSPWRLSACLGAYSIVELPAGTIERTQTARGDLLELSELAGQEPIVPIPNRREPWKILAAAVMVLCGLAVLIYSIQNGTGGANRDFVSYWAAGRQLIHHANPYDHKEVFQIERTVGFLGDKPLIMRNPPTALLMTVPTAFFHEGVAAVLWSLLTILALVFCVRAIRRLNGSPDDRIHLLSYFFPAVIGCTFSGQIGVFLLAGALAFLLLIDSSPFVAGLTLASCTLKPHLYIPVAVVFAAWVAKERRYKVALGALCGTSFLLFAAWLLDPHAWAQFAAMLREQDVNNELRPTISSLFRKLIAPRHPWVQYVPALLASLWAIRYYSRNSKSWTWKNRAPLLLLVSVTFAPYTTTTDEALALPAVIGSLYFLSESDLVAYLYLVCSAIGVGAIFVLHRLVGPIFLWLSLSWILLYVLTRYLRRRQSQRESTMVDEVLIETPLGGA
jgi:uncharacterized membrane protein (UPF0127 family)